MSDITVILNGWKRPQFLEKQIEAIRNQTVPPKEIMMWQNNTDEFPVPGDVKLSKSNTNFGVWARFAYALNADTEYICIFDDDTIPGEKWFENCLNTMKTHEGLLGTVGLVYNNRLTYHNHERFGWPNPNEEVKQVDIVGHAWFFKREWLATYWRELPMVGNPKLVGEDMHFSYMIQKHLGLNTYVPPHPKDDPSMWGSLKGWEFGTERNSISGKGPNAHLMDVYYKYLMDRGFKLIKDGKNI